MIYLAVPFNDPDAAVMQDRAKKVTKAAANIMSSGFDVYSPITHGEALARNGANVNHDRWLEHGIKMMKACDELWVLCLEGWAHSRGVKMEMDEAERLGLHIAYIGKDSKLNDIVRIVE